MTVQRVVSLMPSATEIVCALGCEDRLVGRSHECDFPESVTSLPICTEPTFDVSAGSGAIDMQVRDMAGEGLSVYRVLEDVLAAQQPELILTQDQCDVCAVSKEDVEAAARRAFGGGVDIVSLHPTTLGDVWNDIRTVAAALGIEDEGAEVVSRLQNRMAAIVGQAIELVYRPRVAMIEWIEPLMHAGHWTPELVELAGGKSAFGEPGKPSGAMAWEDFLAADPDVIVVAPCGFDMNRSRGEMDVLTNSAEWWNLRAVRKEQVFVTDGDSFFNRPGPRLAESLEILAEILHPDEFQFGHSGENWQVL